MITDIFNHAHPILVHFPIALIVIGTLYDLYVAWRDGELSAERALPLWIAAFIGGWLSVWTGPEENARGNTDFLDIHSLLANVTAWAVTLLVVVRVWYALKEKNFLRGALSGYLLLAVVCSALVLSTGYYGGKMVYNDGVGVEMKGKLVNPPQERGHK